MLADNLTSYFREKGHPINLAIFRIVISAWTLYYLCDSYIPLLSAVPSELHIFPYGWGRIAQYIDLFNAQTIVTIQTIAIVACVCSLIGICSRTSCIVMGIASIYVLGLYNFFGKVDHGAFHLIPAALLLGVTRCGDAFSVDNLFKKSSSGESIAYKLPLQFFMLHLGIYYFFSGFHKFVSVSDWWTWAFSDNPKILLYQKWFAGDFYPAFRMDQFPLLLQWSMFAVLLWEIAFVFILFIPKLRIALVSFGVVFHSAVLVLMRINFFALMSSYVAVIDWFRMGKKQNRTRHHHRSGVTAVTIVGSLLLTISLYTNIFKINTWPVGIYPIFEGGRTYFMPILEVYIEDRQGEVQYIDFASIPMSNPMRHMYRRMTKNGSFDNEQTMNAFVGFMQQEIDEVNQASVIKVYRTLHDIRPENREKSLLYRELGYVMSYR